MRHVDLLAIDKAICAHTFRNYKTSDQRIAENTAKKLERIGSMVKRETSTKTLPKLGKPRKNQMNVRFTNAGRDVI
jgi:hypothetical protein